MSLQTIYFGSAILLFVVVLVIRVLWLSHRFSNEDDEKEEDSRS